MKEYFESVSDDPREGLRVLPETVLCAAVRDFVQKDDPSTIETAVNRALAQVQKKLKGAMVSCSVVLARTLILNNKV